MGKGMKSFSEEKASSRSCQSTYCDTMRRFHERSHAVRRGRWKSPLGASAKRLCAVVQRHSRCRRERPAGRAVSIWLWSSSNTRSRVSSDTASGSSVSALSRSSSASRSLSCPSARGSGPSSRLLERSMCVRRAMVNHDGGSFGMRLCASSTVLSAEVMPKMTAGASCRSLWLMSSVVRALMVDRPRGMAVSKLCCSSRTWWGKWRGSVRPQYQVRGV